jgi:hypothetical protein
MAADAPARPLLCWWSTVGPVWCRHGVTGAATSMTSGGVGLARPRATQQRLWSLVGVARWMRNPYAAASEDQAAAPKGARCQKGH